MKKAITDNQSEKLKKAEIRSPGNYRYHEAETTQKQDLVEYKKINMQ